MKGEFPFLHRHTYHCGIVHWLDRDVESIRTADLEREVGKMRTWDFGGELGGKRFDDISIYDTRRWNSRREGPYVIGAYKRCLIHFLAMKEELQNRKEMAEQVRARCGRCHKRKRQGDIRSYLSPTKKQQP